VDAVGIERIYIREYSFIIRRKAAVINAKTSDVSDATEGKI